jgi:hypothetical protein
VISPVVESVAGFACFRSLPLSSASSIDGYRTRPSRARLTTAEADPATGAGFTAAIVGLRQHSTPYHLAHGLLDHAEYGR